jgi:hypothetical protein
VFHVMNRSSRGAVRAMVGGARFPRERRLLLFHDAADYVTFARVLRERAGRRGARGKSTSSFADGAGQSARRTPWT